VTADAELQRPDVNCELMDADHFHHAQSQVISATTCTKDVTSSTSKVSLTASDSKEALRITAAINEKTADSNSCPQQLQQPSAQIEGINTCAGDKTPPYRFEYGLNEIIKPVVWFRRTASQNVVQVPAGRWLTPRPAPIYHSSGCEWVDFVHRLMDRILSQSEEGQISQYQEEVQEYQSYPGTGEFAETVGAENRMPETAEPSGSQELSQPQAGSCRASTWPESSDPGTRGPLQSANKKTREYNLMNLTIIFFSV